ncbi:glycosyltransferase [Liquorilactobacillus sicerae]|uniref:glycosyltransferase n=1 Tax=Liquorilactobacillus sicerae TaxID=1416943 RepID=UPI0024814698|nr:glycosyltransferase [Liquorilactobacillus sicerae]
MISVVISTYNGERFIIPQLESIMEQSVLPDEVLVIDDCSTDHTISLVKDFIHQNNLQNWQLSINKYNKGWRRNFIDGIRSCHGDLIFTCDQDDIWRKDKVEIMSKIMEDNANIRLLTSNYCESYENGNKKIGPWENSKEVKRIRIKNNYFLIKSPGCTYCFRKSFATICLKYWQPDYPHDALLWRFAMFADGLYAYTDDLIVWRKHSASTFFKESKNLKTIKEKRKWIAVSQQFNTDLKKFVANEVSGEVSAQISTAKRADQWLETRKKFYFQKNPLIGLKLLFYLDSYPRYRQFLGDWYLIYLKRK